MSGNFPLLQSNFPLSTMAPPIDVPWPPMNFVAEYTAMSTPCSNGRSRYGDTVLSRTSGTPFRWAIVDSASRSATSSFGLPMDSAIDRLHAWRDGLLERAEIVRRDEVHLDAEAWKRVVKEVVGPAVEVVQRDDLIPRSGDVQGARARWPPKFRLATGGRRRCRRRAARGAARRRRWSGSRAACRCFRELLQAEEVRRVLCALELIRGGLEDGHGARARRGVGRLASVKRDGLRAELLV